MKAFMIIESWFGNTRSAAEAIGQELRDQGVDVQMVDVRDASTIPEGTELLILGAPTHNRGLSTPATREKAASAAKHHLQDIDTIRIGIREWLGNTTIKPQQRVAVFDTVTAKSWFAGSAAKAVTKILQSRSPESPIDVRSFIVKGTQGPLAPGELEAAHRWGAELAHV